MSAVMKESEGGVLMPPEDVRPSRATAVAAHPSSSSLLQIAVQRGASIEEIRELRALQREMEADEARKAYNRAFAAFKSEAVRIIKNKKVADGPLKGKNYAELYTVVNAITPALSVHGLSASWKLTKDEKDWIEVTCTIAHQDGHSESVSMGGPPDTGGAKNAIQARASSVSYLERYTLKAITGLSEQDDDNDGRGQSAVVLINAEQEATLDSLIDDVGADRAAFLRYLKVNKLADIPQRAYTTAVEALNAKRKQVQK